MKLDEKSAKGIAIIILVLVAIIVLAPLIKKITGGIGGIFEFLNLNDTAEEKENKTYINNEVNRQNALGTKSAWSPRYYTEVPRGNGFAFTTQQAADLCKQIWDSVGTFWDSPQKAAAAIKQSKNKRNVSFLADGMQDIYKVDLLNWLENKFDTSEQREVLAGILRFVNSLPAN